MSFEDIFTLLNNVESKLLNTEEDQQPRILYHYTTSTGLKGILESKKIWATHYRFLNDKTEYLYGRNLLTELLHELQQETKKTPYESIISTLAHTLNTSNKRNKYGMYIASFTEESDQLSQWRGYADKGLGYSIGLRSITLPSPTKLLYDTNSQRGLLRQFITESLQIAENLEEYITSSDEIEIFYNIWLGHLEGIALTCKNPSFNEEKEWRLLTFGGEYTLLGFDQRPIMHSDEEICFREVTGLLIPYVQIPFQQSDIRSIVIGPSHDFEKAEISIRLLLSKLKYDLKNIKIERSTIPYA